MKNTTSYLREAALLIKGDLKHVNDELKAGQEAKRGVLWNVLCNLLVYAQQAVFADGYTRKKAKQFKDDLMSETGLSEKQVSKYTEAISAGLGVRGVRKGMKSIEGLGVACDNVAMVQQFLTGAGIDTFNKFVRAVRVEKSPVAVVAEAFYELTPKQRDLALKMVDKLDKAQDPGDGTDESGDE